MKEGAQNYDLFARLRGDKAFAAVSELLAADLDASRYIGRAPRQVEEFLDEEVGPLLARHQDLLGDAAEVSV
jgi:adenylosuccinate lyase